MMAEVLLTVPEAAKRLSIGRTMVYELIARRELVSVKVGRARRIPVAALELWVREQLAKDSTTDVAGDSAAATKA